DSQVFLEEPISRTVFGLLGSVLRGRFWSTRGNLRREARQSREDWDELARDGVAETVRPALLARAPAMPFCSVYFSGIAGFTGALGQARAAGCGRGTGHGSERTLAGRPDSGAPAARETTSAPL